MRVVRVTWLDSLGADSRWEYIREMTDAAVCRCVSFGALLLETEQELVVAPHIALTTERGEPDWQACGSMRIPSRAVLEVEELGELT